MRVKICGITNINDASICCDLGADALGFVFYKKSKRFINYSTAEKIIKYLPAFIAKVGVFVDNNVEEINQISQKIGLTHIQLHGNEDIDFASQIILPVIKSFRIDEQFDFKKLHEYKNCEFLLDSFSHEALGGTGKSFNWNLIPKNLRDKIILAGGVSIENIEYIYKNIQPQAVDLSSSVEIKPGKKSHKKLKEFFKVVNNLRYSCTNQ